MSLRRFLTDTVTLERSGTTTLTTGEEGEPQTVATGVRCRIRSAREQDLMRFSSEALVTGAYMAHFAPDAPAVQPNDRLRRAADGITFRALGWSDSQGEARHGTAHSVVPVTRVGT